MSALEEEAIRKAYLRCVEYCDYEEVASVDRARKLITAIRLLTLLVPASMQIGGAAGEQVRVNPEQWRQVELQARRYIQTHTAVRRISYGRPCGFRQ